MRKMIIYFHGYGSSSKSDKATRLKAEESFKVFSFDIDIDPDVAFKQLSHNIDMALIEDMHLPEELIFVGTSLGGWWAEKMAKLYQCKAVIINPSVNPASSLSKYGVAKEIRDKYYEFQPDVRHKYFFAKRDDVINNDQFRINLIESGHDVTIDSKADHRFSGEPFENVVNYLKSL
jgi:predicted esterase YcpF (UPF0227 family)